jgi:hypothetical protein
VAHYSFPESDEFVAEDLGAGADDTPDSLVIFSEVAQSIPKSGQFTVEPPGAPDTVRCTSGQSDVPGWCWFLLYLANSSPILFFFSCHCF